MRKLFNILLASVIGLAFFLTPVSAQLDEDYTWDSTYDYDWDYEYSYDGSEEVAEALGGAGLVFGGIAMIFGLSFGLVMYVFSALALMNIAKRLGEENGWYAWVPILNLVLLFKMGDQNPWLILLMLIPGVGSLVLAILTVIAIMNICEKRGYDKMLGLLTLIPVANLVILGMLAWGKKE